MLEVSTAGFYLWFACKLCFSFFEINMSFPPLDAQYSIAWRVPCVIAGTVTYGHGV